MKTQLIVSTNLNRKESRSVLSSSLIIRVVNVYILLYCTQTYAISWTINPSVQAQEIYSDNIKLARSGSLSQRKESAFVTALNPGVSIIGQSARSSLNFNYRMQNLYNAGGDNGITIFNQLQSNSHNIFIPNKLFLDTNSSISQQNLNNNRPGADNINGSANSTNVYNFGLSPYWTPRFANYANGTVRLDFNSVTVGDNSSQIYGLNSPLNTNLNNFLNSSLDTISDSQNLAETINLNNGSYFQRINWNLSFNNNQNFRINSPDVSFQNSNGRVSTSINKKFNVFAQGGYSNNNFQSTTGSNNSGFYYSLGGQWTPSQRFNITVGAGNNSYVTVYISPMQRLTWITTYTNNAVGTNFGQYSGTSGINGGGNSGSNWQTALNYQTRRSTWSLTHTNNTTTSQQILSQNQIFPTQNQANNLVTNPLPNARAINNPYLNNEVIFTKNWNLSVSFNTGKSTLSGNAYFNDYTYQISNNTQKLIGVSGTWNWKFASQTNAYLSPQWQMTDNQNSIDNSQFFTVSIGVNHSITSQLSSTLEFRHVNQSTSGSSNVSQALNNLANDYQENRVTASLNMRF
jgi:hypothetical protein